MRRHLIRPSTRAFFREGRASDDCTLFDLLHGYFYARWPFLYIGVATGRHPIARRYASLVRFIGRLMTRRSRRQLADAERQAAANRETAAKRAWADGYHGKAMPLEDAKKLVLINEEIRIEDLEQVIPYGRARAIIMKNPERIAVLQCPCRTSRREACHPLDVCLIVGDPFASFVVEHDPKRARFIGRDEAIRIMEEEDARGHVHHAFFKDAMLGRFYAICNCCSCCCGAMKAHRTGTPMLASSGYEAVVDGDLCIACGTCEGFCQFDALSAGDTATVVDARACMGCGVCVSKCEHGAISLERARARGVPLEVQALVV